jgi:hypothetical protein
MSAFAEGVALSTWKMLASHYETANYYPPTGSATTGLSVILAKHRADSYEGESGQEREDMPGTLSVSETDLASPIVDGRFSVASVNWYVTDPPVSNAGIWTCPVMRTSRGSINERRESRGA